MSSSFFPNALNGMQMPIPAKTWLVTGAAGFIGSNLCLELLKSGQHVVGFDNFATGHKKNLDQILTLVPRCSDKDWRFIEGDTRNRNDLDRAFKLGIDLVLHQAALGSVPRSINDPLTSHDVNVNGFINILESGRAHGIERIVYASSSSVYGDHPALPKVEMAIGNPLSPYAATKRANEIYARAWAKSYRMTLIGLRYFNVFGPRQDPNGPYAAVVPKWIDALTSGRAVTIFGDGETSRDFCYIKNVVQANIGAALAELGLGTAVELNIAAHHQTTLNQLFYKLRDGLSLALASKEIAALEPNYQEFRPGDIRHSLADISLAKKLIGYQPLYNVDDGIAETLAWTVGN